MSYYSLRLDGEEIKRLELRQDQCGTKRGRDLVLRQEAESLNVPSRYLKLVWLAGKSESND